MNHAALPVTRPELLAPAGDRECLLAAIENGADAVYFGLQGHNARARAANFDVNGLPELMGLMHRRGVRGYVALNTLVFPSELAALEAIVRRVVEAGTDAVIVQDLGLCELIRSISPDIEIHASTQMSITSVEGVRLARELGCSRVILARELSLREIARLRPEAELPLEVFVHGALCVAYSGQCLTSEALGGRSANRGECAQACRMPYEIVCDGRDVDLGATQYLLSPQDLAAYDLVPRLIELGVASLKIEGRLKSPEYVANITSHYREAIETAMAGREVRFTAESVRDMEMSFSRGFSHGFLDGPDHKILVRGDYAKKRGVRLGRVLSVAGDRVRVSAESPVKPGDGVVFDGDARDDLPEQGGRIYEVATRRDSLELTFGRHDIDLRKLRPGQAVWKTDDPALSRRLRRTFEGPPRRMVRIDVEVTARVGYPVALTGRTATDYTATVHASEPLSPAVRHPTGVEEIREQLGRLGGTGYELGSVTADLAGAPLVPRSLLNALRRELVERLDALAVEPPTRRVAAEPVLPSLRRSLCDPATRATAQPDDALDLLALCRRSDQAMAALAAGARSLYLEFQDPKEFAPAVEAIRDVAADATVFLATPRIEKPGEASLFRFLARAGADGLLVRNAGGISFCKEQGIPFIADFSLNVANELSVGILRRQGARRVTASYDLSHQQLNDLLAAVPSAWLEIVIHQHMPMFHMEHCVYCAFLSPGTDSTNCGRPCDHHEVKLRDRVGMEHPLKADVGCRNTLFNSVPQTAAEYLAELMRRGARHLRVELLDESAEAAARTLTLYREAVDGRRNPLTLWKELKATSRYGVTRGQLAVL